MHGTYTKLIHKLKDLTNTYCCKCVYTKGFSLALLAADFLKLCVSDEEETAEYWLNKGREELEAALNLQQLNMNVARNVIIFLGKLQTRVDYAVIGQACLHTSY